MKTYDEEYYSDWLSDNLFDLRIEYCDRYKIQFLKYIYDNQMLNDSYSRREFCELMSDDFNKYCRDEFNKWCELYG